jgi:hypothetical protein
MLTLALLTMTVATATPLDGAITRYNMLPEVSLPVAMADPADMSKPKSFALPLWLSDVAFDPVEASALVGLVELRDRTTPEQRRKWTAPEYVAGLVAQGATSAAAHRYGSAKPIEFDTQSPPLKSVEDTTVVRYQRRLAELGSCTGALASALTKLRASRPGDDFTRFAFRARQRLGLAMLPPDTRCLRT